MTVSPVAARPGATNFVPGVRIKKLQRELHAGREAGEDLAVLAADVLSVEVTRVNSGAAQYSVTLNNWFDSLPADRKDDLNTTSRRERVAGGRPLWPRYKYNAFEFFEFGDRVRIDMRYWPNPPDDADALVRAAGAWVPMVSGPITDMRFGFSSGEGGRVTVSGEDDLSRLKDKTEGKTEFSKVSERTLVERVLSQAHYPLDRIADGGLPWPDFAEDDDHGLEETLQGGQSYLDFLLKLADRLDFEVFVEFDALAFGRDDAVGLDFHFEPARSGRPPDPTPGGTFVLQRERHLIDFSPTIKVIDQYSEVIVRGRHRDRNQPERVEQLAGTDAVAGELHRDPEIDPPLLSGPAIRERFFKNRPNRADAPNQTNLDPGRGKQLATALLRKKAREFMVVEGTTLGLPRLRPGNHVEIRGFRPPFDGFYYVTMTVHSFGADGLRTKFTARRPGMPAPPYGGR